MSKHHWAHAVHHIHHSEKHGKATSKMAGVAYVVVGVFLAPMLIGIPLIVVGLVKIFK